MSTTAHKPCHILIVDDDRAQIELVSVFLGRVGIDLEIQYCLTIEDAVAAISYRSPDIVFLDNRIPPDIDFRNGFDLIRRSGYDGPVIVNSVIIDDPVLREATALGVTRVVDKFDLREDTLHELIAAYWPPAAAGSMQISH